MTHPSPSRAGQLRSSKASAAPTGRAPPPPLDGEIRFDDASRAASADDFGHIVHRTPEGVLLPASAQDVVTTIRWAAGRGRKFAARARRHSVYGRSQVVDGIVGDMAQLRTVRSVQHDRVVVDAGATWSEVLAATLPRGRTPPVLTDYLELSVGGTLVVGVSCRGERPRAGGRVDSTAFAGERETAGYAHPEALATTGWLAAHLRDPTVRVVDMRYRFRPTPDGSPRPESARDSYELGHVPGALYVDFVSDLGEPGGALGILPPERFAALMGRLGIGNDTTVVVYDDQGGVLAARLWWALRYYGHDAVKLLNGGFTKWTVEGRPLESAVAAVPSARFDARPRPALRSDRDTVLAAVQNRDTTIVDALPAAIYSGRTALYPDHRAGHIPGARNLPAFDNIDPATKMLLPSVRLAEVWRKVGLETGRRVITYCGGGVAASLDLLALHLMGYDDASLYDNSWMEWGADPKLPVESAPEGGAEVGEVRLVPPGSKTP